MPHFLGYVRFFRFVLILEIFSLSLIKLARVVGTAKQLWENQAEEVGLSVGKGLQNFAEVRASGNAVGQKAGSPSFCLIVRWGPGRKSIFTVLILVLSSRKEQKPPAANERDWHWLKYKFKSEALPKLIPKLNLSILTTPLSLSLIHFRLLL